MQKIPKQEYTTEFKERAAKHVKEGKSIGLSADGMSNKEIRRCLKRYIVRELYPFIIAGLGAKINIS